MKRILLLALLACSIAVSPAVKAFRASDRAPLPNYDKREKFARAKLSPGRAEAAARLQERVDGTRVQVDPITGSPRFVASTHGFLSGPDGLGKGISVQSRRAIPDQDTHAPIKAFLNEHSALYGHGAEVLDSAVITREYTTAHNGLKTTVWEQQVDGIPVFQGLLIGHITKDGELVNVASQLVPDAVKAAAQGTPNHIAVRKSPPVNARRAIVEAARNIGEILSEDQPVAQDGPAGPHQRQHFKAAPVLNGDIDTQLSWLPMNADEMRLCWQVILTSHTRGEMFRVLVDIETGEVLLRHGLTEYISNASYRVFTGDSPSPMSPGLPVPANTQPPLVQRTLVVTNAFNTNASPNGWINDPDNETRGNNVDAHLDRNNDDQPDLPRPQGNPNRVFDPALNLAQAPTTYGDAAVVQLFYLNNVMHDRLYELGFTEAAGNFQNTNFNRGGLGNDAVQADAQDGSGTDNANFSTPPDGSPGRMQMYVFATPIPNRDGDFDAEVVLHEYTHGLSNRRVGGGALISALQTSGMGEGWSDFYALSILSDPADDPNAVYAMGGYVTYQYSGLTENYYYGIRHYPYCTDTNKNPYTLKDIDPAQALAHTGVPISPAYGFDPNQANEVHNQGEVWCVTLWDARALVIAKYGSIVGNRLMLQIVTDGMGLSPVNPTFLEARDAIIQADLINNGGANFNELWAAFAKRGMGGSATVPPSNSTSGIEEAYDLPGLALKRVVPIDASTGNGNGSIDPNECTELSVVLVNNNRVNSTGIRATIATTTPGVLISQADSAYPDIGPGATGTNNVLFRFYTSPGFVCGTVIQFTVSVTSDQDVRTLTVRLSTGLVGSPVSFGNSTVMNIPDGSFSGIDSPVTVSGFNSAISKVTVSLYVTHPFDFDLTMALIGPDNTRVILTKDNGFFGRNFGNNCTPESSRTTFDDKASVPISAGRAPYVGSFRPDQPLAAFIGKSGTDVNGLWRLHIVDAYPPDAGALQCWTLNLSPTVCSDGGGDCSTDLALSGSFKPQIALVNSNITYTYTLTNRGPNTARNVTFNDVLPAGMNFVSSTTTSGSCVGGGGQVNCSIGTMAAASAAAVTITVLPTVAGTITNIATLASTVTDLIQTNNTSILVTQVLPPSPVIVPAGTRLISESSLPANGGLDPGETVTIDFAMQNLGTLPTANLVATLLNTAAISSPSAPKTYGSLSPGGSPVTNRYTFTANGLPGATINATFQLQDGTNNLGNLSFPFTLANTISFTNFSVLVVPDSGAASLYPSSIPVSGVAGLINKVTVTIPNISHTSPDDLDVLLVGPNGRSVLLMSDAGGGSPLNHVTLTFDDDVALPLLPDDSAITSGAYRPSDYPPADIFPAPAPAPPAGGAYGTSLAIFNSSNPNGLWSLYVFDDAEADSGRLDSGWSITISTFDPVNPTADLAVFGSASPDPVTFGGNITYSLTVTNQGPQTASGIVLSNQVPSGTTFVSATSPGLACSNANGVVVCGIGTLTNHARAIVTIQVATTRTGPISDVARVSGNVDDYNSANNIATITSAVSQAADLQLSMAALPATGIISNNLSILTTVTNLGPDNASSVVVSNVLPSGVPFVSATPSQGSCSNNAGTVICALGTIAKNSRATVTVVVKPTSVGTLATSASVSAGQPVDLVPANNIRALNIPVNNPALIIVAAGNQLLSESFAPPTGGIDPGETVTLNLGLRNLGTSNTTSLIGTLRAAGGVGSPSAPQNYGVLAGQGSAVSRPFTFTASGSPGSAINATLDVADLANGQSNSLGSVLFSFVMGTTRRFSNTTSNGIPDNSAALIYPSQIQVSGLTGVISHVSVTLSNITHPYPDDLDFLLVAPGGRSVLLMSDVGGSSALNHVTLILDDDASVSLADSGPITSGTYKPTDANGGDGDAFPAPAPVAPFGKTLSTLNGIDPNGAWSLFAQDDAFGDLGNLEGGWSLTITTAGSVPHLVHLRAPLISAGRFQCFIDGAVGDNLVIQGSTDLQNWVTVGNVTINAAGSGLFRETSGTGSFRFYRAIQQ